MAFPDVLRLVAVAVVLICGYLCWFSRWLPRLALHWTTVAHVTVPGLFTRYAALHCTTTALLITLVTLLLNLLTDSTPVPVLPILC